MAQERKNANQEVLAQTDVVDNNDNRTSFDMASSTPAELTNHVSKTYIIAGITPGQFLEYHGSFNFSDLQARFSTICKDYMPPLDLNNWRRGKRTDNKIYRLKFPYVTEESKLITTTCFISDYRGVEYKENYKAGSSISLNITLAGMLAVCVLNQLVSIGIKLNVMLLTPLAAACFKKDDIKELAKATYSSTEQVLKDINSGCQSGGQYLPNGYLHVALCSVIVCTKGLTNNKMRENIIGKTIKQYYQCIDLASS
ncbi:uncharacterized protein LOC123308548 [Coccinella septempunctata]|uniref:uncharacterized protein LOC123308548 n=1 Tax=Coccinella septempunctata TaxID=41139 RepID=UPI001D07D67B|nr:uncharacterized protein LOC123308548 [Coccinella septempunctata]